MQDVYLSTVTLEEISECLEPKRSVLRKFLEQIQLIMEKPILSPDFTIEDKLREYNYHITKDMAPQERRNYYNESGMAFQKEIEEARLQKV